MTLSLLPLSILGLQLTIFYLSRNLSLKFDSFYTIFSPIIPVYILPNVRYSEWFTHHQLAAIWCGWPWDHRILEDFGDCIRQVHNSFPQSNRLMSVVKSNMAMKFWLFFPQTMLEIFNIITDIFILNPCYLNLNKQYPNLGNHNFLLKKKTCAFWNKKYIAIFRWMNQQKKSTTFCTHVRVLMLQS